VVSPEHGAVAHPMTSSPVLSMTSCLLLNDYQQQPNHTLAVLAVAGENGTYTKHLFFFSDSILFVTQM